MGKSKNPNWTKDELILALDLYLRGGRKVLSSSNPDVRKLSEILNQLPIHSTELRMTKFRNPNGIEMKLGNFRSIDPLVLGSGLTRGNKLERVVWEEYHDQPTKLKEVTDSIISHSNSEETSESSDVTDNDQEEFPEGKILTRIHKYRERNPTVVRKKKKSVLEQYGKLECEVCQFDFQKTYGSMGQDFCECHHTLPVSKLTKGHRTRLSDLSIVCSNCHRMLHRGDHPPTIPDLRETIRR